MESSILSAACSLRSLVPKEINSPFSNSPNLSSQSALTTFALIRSTLLSFEREILSKSESGITERYLSLLRESSGSSAVLLNHSVDNLSVLNILKENRLKRIYPILSSSESINCLELIKYFGSELKLDIFSDNLELNEILIISLGAKVMVIDFEINIIKNSFNKIKFNYSFDNHAKGSIQIDSLLLKLLSNSIDITTTLKQRESTLKQVYYLLKQLKNLDNKTELYKLDLFEQSNSFHQELHDYFLSLGTNSIERLKIGSGIPSLNELSLGFTLLYQLSSRRSLSLPTELIELESTLTDTIQLQSLLQQSGTYSATISVDSPLQSALGNLIEFNPKIIISKFTGKQLNTILGIGESSIMNSSSSVEGLKKGGNELQDYLVTNGLFNQDDLYQIDNRPIKQTYQFIHSSNNPGFILSQIHFTTMNQLQQIIAVIKDQILINDLFQSIFNSYNKVVIKDEFNFNGEERIVKRLKLSTISLEDLLSDKPIDSIPISISISTNSNSISLTFPSPHTKPIESFPITLTISSESHSTLSLSTSSSSSQILKPSLSIQFGRSASDLLVDSEMDKLELERQLELEKKLEGEEGLKKMEKILIVGRDLTLVVRFILRSLLD